MKNNNRVLRNLDKIGRIVIPKKIRDNFEIVEDDPIEIFVDGDSIILKKYIPKCFFCGNDKNLIEYNKKIICKNCIKDIGRLTKK